MICKRVEDPSDLLSLMKIRNEVRLFMTNSQKIIEWDDQVSWFSDLDHNLIKIWLYGEESGPWLGYGLLKIELGDIKYGVTTYALTESARGRGYGEEILKDLIQKASTYDCKCMRAEIFKNNEASLGLTSKLGYTKASDMGDIVEMRLSI